MTLRFHEIAEQNNRILNPFTQEKLMLLGEICGLGTDTHLLDLCCGKAEMLCQWSRRWGMQGVGVDISTVFLHAGRQRAKELGVEHNIEFVEGDAGQYLPTSRNFDVVSCIGATWIGDGFVGTAKYMKQALKPDGLILIGEPYWITRPPDDTYVLLDVEQNEFTSLIGTLDRIEEAGLELIEMVCADANSWDRYSAPQWLTVDNWLRANPDHVDAQELEAWNAKEKRNYLEYFRHYLGWAVFVTRMK